MSTATAVPSGFSIDLPHDWLELDFELASNRSRLEHELLNSTPGTDNDDTTSIVDLLYRTVVDALENGAVYIAMLSGSCEHLLAASLVVTVATGECPEDIEVVNRRVTQLAGVSSVRLVDTAAAGPVVRAHRCVQTSFRGWDDEICQDQVQYFIPVPESSDTLIMTFSTPSLDLAEALGDLFDAITGTLRWL